MNKHSNWKREKFEAFRDDEFVPELQDTLVVQFGGLWRAINRAVKEGIRDAEEKNAAPCVRRHLVKYKPEIGVLSILTRASRDPLRSKNGGEYDFYAVFRQTPIGVSMEDDWSCDFADPNPEWMRPTLFVGASLEDAYALLEKVPYHTYGTIASAASDDDS